MTKASARPRIAILAPLKEWGGLERKFSILTREFLDLGVDVDFLRIRGGMVPYPEQFPKAAEVVDLGTRSKRDGIPAVARYLRGRAPSALLTAKDHAAQVGVMARSLACSPTRVFIKTTNMPSEVIRRPFQRFMARRLYRRADGVIAISQGVRADVVENFSVPPRRVHLIYNPMVTRDFAQRLAAPLEHPWAEQTDVPLILGAGRLTRQKDFVTLIEAFARLRQRRACRLLIVGEGKERAALETLIDEHGLGDDVALPGAVHDPVPLMQVASVFVLSSRYEGLGNVLVEAMAAGTRLVSTDCPSGPAEILEHGRFGDLVTVGDAPGMADAIGRALDGPRPDPHALASSLERFRDTTVARRYLEVMGLMSGGTRDRDASYP